MEDYENNEGFDYSDDRDEVYSKVSFEKHKIFLYKEDFDKFTEGLEEVMGVVRAALEGRLPEKY